MKLVITFCISGFHSSAEKLRKQFNPILGETYQASFQDGTTIFAEQISHHPPISAWQVFGPNVCIILIQYFIIYLIHTYSSSQNTYHMHGCCEWIMVLKGNSFCGYDIKNHFMFLSKSTVIFFHFINGCEYDWVWQNCSRHSDMTTPPHTNKHINTKFHPYHILFLTKMLSFSFNTIEVRV